MTSSRRFGDSAIRGTTRQQSKSLVRTWLIWGDKQHGCRCAVYVYAGLLSWYLQYSVVGAQAAQLRRASGPDVANVNAAIQQTVGDAETKVLQI